MNYLDPGFRRKNAGARLDDAVDLNTITAAIKARDSEFKSWLDKAALEIKDTGKMASETKSALDKISNDSAALADRLIAVEQKLSRRAGAFEDVKTIGERFTDSDDFKAMAQKGGGTATLNLKAATVTSATADAAGSAGSLIVPDRQPGILTPAQEALTIRDLLLPGRTSSNAIEYVQETGFTNAAAPVAEGADKPQSDLKFELVPTTVRTIAHWLAASKQILQDVPMLQSYIDTRLTFGLKYEEELQLLTGNGSGESLLGLLPQASLFNETAYSGAEDTRIDTIRRAVLQARIAQFRPTFIVLNPIDWAEIELTKDDTGRYIWVNVQVGGTMQIWRLAVIETTAMAVDTFLVGASMGAQVFDREDAIVEVSTQHSDFFTKNKVAIRAEERLALAVYRPQSFVYGQFTIGGSPDINL